MMSTMTNRDAEQARQRLRKLARDRQRIAETEADTIAAALRLGVRQIDVAKDIARTREHVRRIAERYGIPSVRRSGTNRPAAPHDPVPE
jgi:uncharacterized protein YicC (UPF0701 family)